MKTLKTIRSPYAAIATELSLVFLAVILASYLLISYLQQSTGQYMRATSLIQNADRDLHQSRLALGSLVFDKNMNHIANLEAEMKKNTQQARDRMIAFQKLTLDVAEIQALLAQINHAFIQWNRSNQSILGLAKNNQYADALIAFVGINQSRFHTLRSLYDLSGQLIFYYSVKQQQKIKHYVASFQIVIGSLAVLVLCLSVLLAWITPRNLSRAVTQFTSRSPIGSKAEQSQRIVTTQGHLMDHQASSTIKQQNKK